MEDNDVEFGEPPEGVLDLSGGPTTDQILALLDSFGLSDEDRELLKQELLYQKATEDLLPPHIPPPVFFTSQMLMLLAMLVFLSFIFVFFGYKLYKSLTDKERKREEKKKQKQQKKRK